MKTGIHLKNGGRTTSASSISTLAARAEELGFNSVWVSDHIAIPAQIESVYPVWPGVFRPEDSQNYWEALTVLAFVAGMTKRVELGTSVLVLPQRPPLLIAKQWATLDALSGGRTILGIGAGWMREEFVALGADTFERRGLATDEALRIYRAVWTQQGDVSFEGEVYRFDPLRALPKPAQPSGPPIWVGGHGRRSIRRAAELGDGWHVIRMGLDELRAGTATLRDLLGRADRRPEEVTLSAVLSAYAPGAGPQGQPRDYDLVGGAERAAETLRRYQEAGVEHVILNAYPRDSVAPMLEALEYVARDVRPLLAA